MAVISNCICVDVLAIVITIAIGIITYFKWIFKYWKRKGLPYAQPSFPFGTVSNPFGQAVSFGEECKAHYEQFKEKGHYHVGLFIFSTPMYMPIGTEHIKNILARDFSHFVNRGLYYNEKDDPVSANLFFVESANWRNLRTKLTPTFTSSKMKMMFQTVVECGNQLKEAMDDFSLRKSPVDIRDILSRFTINIIGSCAFGLECNSFKDPNSEFRIYGKKIFANTTFQAFKSFVAFSNQRLAKFFGIILTPKDSANFFMNVIKNAVEYRENNNIVRKDFLQLLIDLKKSTKMNNAADQLPEHDGKALTIEEIAAEAFVFFIAGYETSSTTMNFCLFELSLNPDIQEKVRKEVKSVLEKHNGIISYEALSEMKYMEQVIDETLRKYPPLPFLNRECLENYKIRGTDVVIEKGTPVVISVLGVHHDAEYYPNPEKFDPERFNERNKQQIKPFTYLPFGEGPRICIGLRFGLMQTKVGLTVLLKNYKFSLNEKTKTPLKMEPFNIILSPVDDIWLNIEKVVEE